MQKQNCKLNCNNSKFFLNHKCRCMCAICFGLGISISCFCPMGLTLFLAAIILVAMGVSLIRH